ncbi:MAG TPA: ribosome maturation factor RimM [Stellaceae bacterium]|nr:ribosome maturation factor RimM [Stellaceae bacterium]
MCLGIITGAHGIRGRVRVKSFTADPEAIAAYGPLSDESGARRFDLELTGAQKGVLIAYIKGVDDRNAAEALRGLRLYVNRAALPPPEEDEFYETDLIGLEATRDDGAIFGTIRGVNDFGAGASLEIEDPAGKTVVVPFTNAAVPVVDIANKRVVVVPPAGLFDAPSRDENGRDEDGRNSEDAVDADERGDG